MLKRRAHQVEPVWRFPSGEVQSAVVVAVMGGADDVGEHETSSVSFSGYD